MQQQTKKQVDSSWERMPKALRQRTDLNSNHKLLYAYMLDKYTFFSSKGLEFYESLESMAKETGMGKNTVVRSLEVLIENGMLFKTTRAKKGAFKECVYVVPDIYMLFDQGST